MILQIFLYTYALKQNKMRKLNLFNLSNFYLKLKNIIMFLAWSLFFNFLEVHNIHSAVSTLPNIAEIDLKIGKVFSTLSNVIQINVEIDKVDSMLLNIVSSNADVHNVDSTMG